MVLLRWHVSSWAVRAVRCQRTAGSGSGDGTTGRVHPHYVRLVVLPQPAGISSSVLRATTPRHYSTGGN